MLRSVLIANRGEIALRVARTCREMGIGVVTVHSEADVGAAASRLADRAVQIGPAAAKRSYLNPAAVIQSALQWGAQGIHPGYGFLSEDPDFAEACEASGLVFIGPPARVMRELGDKSRAREVMSRHGLPLLAGGPCPTGDLDGARRAAAEVGFPLIIKAVAGGGGRGMRVVRAAEEFDAAFMAATAEAQSVFANPGVYVEQYLDSARHVEVQVLTDACGNGVHLGARDCSIQRRHQKLVEETPPPTADPHTIERICSAAVHAALAVGYRGAGTLEFLLDEAGNAYFMEINCRIQVEHPVTEMTTGVDIVRQQLVIASGLPLEIGQADVVARGVSIECRVNAEDPNHDFAPAPGLVTEFDQPGGPFTRVDTHVAAGYQIPTAYDSLLAKLIVWAPQRDQAVARMVRALEEFHVAGPGIRTTIPFLLDVMHNDEFATGQHNLALVARMLSNEGNAGHKAASADPEQTVGVT